MKCSLVISNLLEEISSLSYSVAFLYFFALIAEEGFLISPYYSLQLCIQMLISGEGNGKPLQYSCIENPMNSISRVCTINVT